VYIYICIRKEKNKKQKQKKTKKKWLISLLSQAKRKNETGILKSSVIIADQNNTLPILPTCSFPFLLLCLPLLFSLLI
jgi:hypothetical protein